MEKKTIEEVGKRIRIELLRELLSLDFYDGYIHEDDVRKLLKEEE